ncbi:hypothetical protein [Pedobacter heparinus]|uniref:hypothetical protein n=1 Tax=Pedobacter heparinus TaxID=984 RepID=UPI00292DCD59|nr:hypothetical protein [Pedobacter heparinus]
MIKDRKETKLSSNVSINDYEALFKVQSKQAIADFIYQRLTERYITPMENVPGEFKNGFSIMANCCLLIETYQCFRLGLKDTTLRGKGLEVFRDFFDNEPLFGAFIGMGELFYTNVRCGILHQGETKNGWTISRKYVDPLFDKKTLRINANLFLVALKKTLDNYRNQLINEGWNTVIWQNCHKKIQCIIDNC